MGERLWLVFREGRLLVLEGEASVLQVDSLESLGLETSFEREVGTLDGFRCIAAGVEPEVEAPEGMEFRELRGLIGEVDEEFFWMAGRAKQIVGWNRTHRFCGRCGARTVMSDVELAMECPVCGLISYPRISPAAIMLVTHENKMLLARSPHFPPGRYSTLAGFVEPGESIEQTVRREVREEVGVEVGNIRYFGSQSWPFPNSLMLGFIAEYAGGEIHRDPEEIEDARWFSADDLPVLPPRLTIARQMIEAFVQENGRTGSTNAASKQES